MIRCNWCKRVFTSEAGLTHRRDNQPAYRGCPFCFTDMYLENINDTEVEE